MQTFTRSTRIFRAAPRSTGVTSNWACAVAAATCLVIAVPRATAEEPSPPTAQPELIPSFARAGCVADGSRGVRISLAWKRTILNVLLSGDRLTSALNDDGAVELAEDDKNVWVCKGKQCGYSAGIVALTKGSSDDEGQSMKGLIFWPESETQTLVLPFKATVTGSNKACGTSVTPAAGGLEAAARQPISG